MNKEILNVKKRNGRGSEPLNIEKIHEMVEYACEDITGVSSSQVEMNSGLQFYDGMTTDEIQQILIKSASDLISLENPNYQYVATRLLLYSLRKQIFRRLWDHPHIYDHVKKCVDKGVYDSEILNWYDKKDFDRMENWVTHERDYDFTYAGLRQVIDKYLVQDRSTNQVFETPQFMYMMISATLFAKYPKNKRMSYVKKYYDAISKFKINIPTPVMAVLEHLFANMLVVCWLMLMILCLVFSVVIWLLAIMLHKGLVSVLTLGESEGLIPELEAVKSNTQELYHSSKSLKQRLSVVLKTVLEVGVQRFTSLFGTKK